MSANDIILIAGLTIVTLAICFAGVLIMSDGDKKTTLHKGNK